jgi:hypothetical protein
METADAEPENGAAASENPVFDDSIFNMFDSPATEQPSEKETAKKAPVRKGEVFAAAVLNRWQEQLAHLAQDAELHSNSGLTPEWLAETTQEIIKGASRLHLKESLAEESDTVLNAPNATRFLRKTSARAAAMLNRYVLDLGQPVAEKPIPVGPPKATLSAKAYPGLGIFQHWTTALIQLFKDNVAEASADDEQSNKALEQILKATFD